MYVISWRSQRGRAAEEKRTTFSISLCRLLKKGGGARADAAEERELLRLESPQDESVVTTRPAEERELARHAGRLVAPWRRRRCSLRLPAPIIALVEGTNRLAPL